MLTWHRLGSLVRPNILHHFVVNCTHLCTITPTGYSGRIMHHITGPKLPKIGLRSIQRMVWLLHFPYMCPIHHLWDVVERPVLTRGTAHTNIRELWIAIQIGWLNLTQPDVFWSPVESVLSFSELERTLHNTRHQLLTFGIIYGFWYNSYNSSL